MSFVMRRGFVNYRISLLELGIQEVFLLGTIVLSFYRFTNV